MLKFMRHYGWYIFFVPSLIFLIDDVATGWHEHGHETLLRIILENLTEDVMVLFLCWAARLWVQRPLQQLHVQCPYCNKKWMMHPKYKIAFCPRCGAAEPP